VRRLLIIAAAAASVLVAAPTSSAALPFTATLTATGHSPKVGQPWYFMVRVRDRSGRPIAASILPQIVIGRRVLDTVGSTLIWGACGQPFTWRRVHAGRNLTFRVQVQTQARVVNLSYAVRVRR